ncbi:MAG: tRNA preQ1(34) S-adenosylmethionine ribosyltransferase-isomerase QueA [Syntrophus sp. (in: bacteria)]|nr:tRNA preQ1(34) S-adenosylmethionine ribosyltransferase-isomerase QueA [Syntrophus sp. (in: bacteria)]
MRIEEFDYFLPKELIAQHPERERASSRLLVLNRAEKTIEHVYFSRIVDYLHEGDLLVLNDSRVFPARLKAVKETGGVLDILLVEKRTDNQWLCLVKGARKGTKDLTVSMGQGKAVLSWDDNEGSWVINLLCHGNSFDFIRKYGVMPLPPYVKRKEGSDPEDFERYQTVYAEPMGSIAAPTAGFHFTEGLLDQLAEKGVNVAKITLHIGIGTFSLIKTEMVEEHVMHREYYELSPEVKAAIMQAKKQGRRVIACGTSAVRTLETIGSLNGNTPLAGYTDIFIYPGYPFKAVDALITNFHLPRSTPLLLAAAFAGRDEIKWCYREAVAKGYRFYSYGDAMLVV